MKTLLNLLGAIIIIAILSNGCKKEGATPDVNPTTNLPVVINQPADDTCIIYDVDKNKYHYIKIGNQYWMKENLKTLHYNNGDPIPNIAILTTAWNFINYGACSNYYNAPDYPKDYGYMYNYMAIVDSRKLCPPGWHVPTDSDWDKLTDYLGGETIAGAKLKEKGTSHWISPNAGATNSSLFTALPGGCRVYSLTCIIYAGLYHQAFFWSSTLQDQDNAWMREINIGIGYFSKNTSERHEGMSVRLIKD